MKHGEAVTAFERELADYCQAKYCIAAANGTVTLQAALIALGVNSGDQVATTPLTMAATTIGILNVGAVPVFVDVGPKTWLMPPANVPDGINVCIPVSLYGLRGPQWFGRHPIIDDAAQTLRPHTDAAFTSYSFQASKILALGEGGALLTNDEDLAEAARSYLSLGYRMNGKARIDSEAIKSPTAERHIRYPSINGRMNDLTAAAGLCAMDQHEGAFNGLTGALTMYPCGLDALKADRIECAIMYGTVIADCDWLTPQHVPDGWTHDYWAYAVACDTPQRAIDLANAVVAHGGEKPYFAWRLTYDEPAFAHLAEKTTVVERDHLPIGYQYGVTVRPRSICPVAESLQPRLLQFQTNSIAAAQQNSRALARAIEEVGVMIQV